MGLKDIIARAQGHADAYTRDHPDLRWVRETFLPRLVSDTEAHFNGLSRSIFDTRRFRHQERDILLGLSFPFERGVVQTRVCLEIWPAGRDPKGGCEIAMVTRAGSDGVFGPLGLSVVDGGDPEKRRAIIDEAARLLRSLGTTYLSYTYDRFSALMPGEYLDPTVGDALEPARPRDFRLVSEVDAELDAIRAEVGQQSAADPALRARLQEVEEERHHHFLNSSGARILEYQGRHTFHRPEEDRADDLGM